MKAVVTNIIKSCDKTPVDDKIMDKKDFNNLVRKLKKIIEEGQTTISQKNWLSCSEITELLR